jgi:hypothetical protein
LSRDRGVIAALLDTTPRPVHKSSTDDLGRGARADLLEDLIGVGAAVHGELPHDPVAVVVVARGDGGVEAGPAVGVGVGLGGGLELNAGGPAVVEEVLDLAGDLLVGEGGEEGESLEELVAVGLPHHHGVGVGGLAGGDHGGLVEDGGNSGDSGHFGSWCRSRMC